MKMKSLPSFVKSKEQFDRDRVFLVGRNLISVIDSTSYLVTINAKGLFEYRALIGGAK